MHTISELEVAAGPAPPRLSAHTATRLGDTVWVIGGRRHGAWVSPVNDGASRSIGVWKLHLSESPPRWERVECQGSGPGQRWGHSSCHIGDDKIFVFGGFDHQCNFGDGYVLDTRSLEWKPSKFNGDTVHYRAYHSALCVSGTHVVLFGGCYCESGTYAHFNDVHVLDLSTQTWRKISCKNTSAQPSPRSQHAAVLLGRCMAIVGGYDGRAVHNQVHLLDLNTYTWSLLPTAGDLPSARGLTPRPFRIFPASRGAVALGSRIMVVGNFHRFQDEPLRAFALSLSDKIPASDMGADVRMSPLQMAVGHFDQRSVRRAERKRRRKGARGSPPGGPRASPELKPTGREKLYCLWKCQASRVHGRPGTARTAAVPCSPDNHAVVMDGSRILIFTSGKASLRVLQLRMGSGARSGVKGLLADMVELGERVSDFKSPESAMKITTDATLRVANHTFGVHRALLSARCEFFRAMWSSKMAEARCGRAPVDIGGVPNAAVFRSFLKFVYSGRVDHIAGDELVCADMLMLADRFGCDPLSRTAERLAVATLSRSNVARWLALADRAHSQFLRAQCVEFLSTLSTKHARAALGGLCQELKRWAEKEVQKTRRESPDCKRRRSRTSPGGGRGGDRGGGRSAKRTKGRDPWVPPAECSRGRVAEAAAAALLLDFGKQFNDGADPPHCDVEIVSRWGGAESEPDGASADGSHISPIFRAHRWLLEARGCTAVQSGSHVATAAPTIPRRESYQDRQDVPPETETPLAERDASSPAGPQVKRNSSLHAAAFDTKRHSDALSLGSLDDETEQFRRPRRIRVNVQDVAPESVSAFLRLMYLGQLELPGECRVREATSDDLAADVTRIHEIVEIARAVGNPGVTGMCERALCERVDQNNAAHYLLLGLELKMNQLRDLCFDVVAMCRFHPERGPKEYLSRVAPVSARRVMSELSKREAKALRTHVEPEKVPAALTLGE